MAKKRILVKGNVQGVGFRAFVRQYAFNMDVKGLVRNLSDKTVEIYCDAQEGALKNFLRALKVKGDKMDPFVINVEQITVFDEKSREYRAGKVPRSFKEFIVDYGAGLTKAEREAAERDEYTILAGQRLGQKMDTGFKGLGQKMDTGFNGLGQKVDGVGTKVDRVGQDVRAMHKDMNERFDKLDAKYHILGESLVRTSESIEHMNKNNEHLITVIEKMVENQIQKERSRSKRTGPDQEDPSS
jgi:acylphosphatase